MFRSGIALAALVLTTALPAIAVAAPNSPAPVSCNACAAPFNDPQQGPFARRDYVTSVEPYRVTETNLKHAWTHLEGAVVKLRPPPGSPASGCSASSKTT